MKKNNQASYRHNAHLLGLTIGICGAMIQFPWSLIGPLGLVVALIGFLLLVRQSRLQ